LSHLELLAVVATAETVAVSNDLNEYLTTRLPDQDLENIKLDWSDLERWGMLQGIPMGLASTPVHMRYWNAFNAFGKRFAEFVEALPDDGATDE
jgi:hypothetical protein